MKEPVKVPNKNRQCSQCGEPILPLPPMMVEKIYGKDGDVRGLRKMCPKCRKKVLWKGGVTR